MKYIYEIHFNNKLMIKENPYFNIIFDNTYFKVYYNINKYNYMYTKLYYMNKYYEYNFKYDTEIIQKCLNIYPIYGSNIIDICPDQFTNIKLQIIKDIFYHISKLMSTHPNSLLGYSVWYINNASEPTTYIEYIKLKACTFIAKTKLISYKNIFF